MKASCIIPTWGRDRSVIIQTVESLLALGSELTSNCLEIVLIDQNGDHLELQEWAESRSQLIDYLKHRADTDLEHYNGDKIRFIHVVGLRPSVTIAKNYGVKICSGEMLLFFDDDVIVKPNCVQIHCDSLRNIENIGLLGGREIVEPRVLGRSNFRETIVAFAEKIIPSDSSEDRFKYQGRYIGRIKANSFMMCNFDVDNSELVQVDTVRGCNWSTTKKIWQEAGGFDENFQGTALREETDLYLRIEKCGYQNYFHGQAVVIHMRQLGGCNNISKEYRSLVSKFENELFFQYKHFSDCSAFYYFMRLIPLALESAKKTMGMSLYLLLQNSFKLFVLFHFKCSRKRFEKGLTYIIRKIAKT